LAVIVDDDDDNEAAEEEEDEEEDDVGDVYDVPCGAAAVAADEDDGKGCRAAGVEEGLNH
jgi:hypothetical protein